MRVINQQLAYFHLTIRILSPEPSHSFTWTIVIFLLRLASNFQPHSEGL